MNDVCKSAKSPEQKQGSSAQLEHSLQGSRAPKFQDHLAKVTVFFRGLEETLRSNEEECQRTSTCCHFCYNRSTFLDSQKLPH